MENEKPVCGFIDYPDGHVTVWEEWQRQGLVPRTVEYEEPPRGRVLYKVAESRFVLYLDRCIVRDPKMTAEVKRVFDLPVKGIVIETDGHYACAACLARRGE